MRLKHRATIVPLAFFLIGILGTTILYRAIEATEQRLLQMETLTTAKQVRLRLEAWLDSRAALVTLLADRQFSNAADVEANFTHQAQTLIDLYPGFQALNFIDRQWVIRTVVPAADNQPALGSDLHDHPSPGVVAALQRASEETGVFRTPVIDLLQGGKGIALYRSMYDTSGVWLGYADGVFRVRELIDSCLYESGLREDFSYRLTAGGGTIAYQWETEQAPATGDYQVELPVRIVDRDWLLTIRPTPDHIAEARTSADELMTVLGIVMIGLLAVLLHVLLRRQDALRESQAKYRLLVENQVDMVVKLDPAGNFLYVSPSFCETFDRREEELLGTHYLPFVHPEDRAGTQAALEAVHRPPHRSYHEYRALTQQGVVWQSWTNVAVLDTEGRLEAVTTLGHDITRRRELEDQLVLSRKMQAVGQLAGGIAHDFNNTLQAMLGHLQFVMEDLQPTGQAAEDLAEIERGIDKTMKLTRQLLAFGRRQGLQTKREDLNGILAEALKPQRRSLPSRITLEAESSGQPVIVQADRGQIEQIIHELCDNAHAAITGAGTIRVRTEVRELAAGFCSAHPGLEPGAYGALVVSDDGHGMSPNIVQRIFEPFFTTRDVSQGAGLGLSASYSIVRQHHGTIGVESEPGRGSAVTVLLPLADSDETTPPDRESNIAPAKQTTILLAEDNQSVRNLAVRVLERAGYSVLVAEDGQEAVEVFNEHGDSVDLVILDQVMPRVGGREACRAILEKRTTVPILFASGFDPMDTDKGTPVPDGIDVLMKPYGIADLLQKVRSILDDASSAGPAAE